MSAAERTHRLLVVGTGSIGERHVRCFLATGRAEVGICEPSDSVRERVANDYTFSDAFAELDDALNKNWDAVLIASPAHTHVPIARRVAQTGIPLLIEKPLSISMDGVLELKDEVEGRNLVAAVSYNYRAHPALRAMKMALDDGRFGRIRHLYCTSGQDFAYFRPAYREIYFADPAQGGGALQDAVTHLINAGEWLAGPIDRLAADAAHQQLEGVDVEDTVSVLARHGDVMASYTMNMYQHPNETTLTAVCERGTARFEVHNSRWRWMNETVGDWYDEVFPFENRDSWYVANANAFLDALEGAAPPLCSLADGIQTLRTILTARKAIDSGTWCDVEATRESQAIG